MESVKRCSKCAGNRIFICDTRTNENGAVVRKRICMDCGHDFKTIELRADELAVDIEATVAELMGIRQRVSELYNFFKSVNERGEGVHVV